MSELRLRIDGFANGGAGVARDDGRVVFVSGALPGELVTARIVDDSRPAFARAETVEVLEPSDHRVAQACPAAAAGAGCCDLSYVEPGYARALRADALADVLTRIGGFDGGHTDFPEVTALDDASSGWRVRTRVAVGDDGQIGLRARRSTRVVTAQCSAPAAGMLDDLAALNPRPGTELAVALGSDGVRQVSELSTRQTRGKGASRRGAQRRRSAAARERSVRMLEGDGAVTQQVGERSWTVPPSGFWQAHRHAPQTYSDTVREMVTAAGLDGTGLHAWDLYGGAGVFSAALLDGPTSLAGVDLVETDPDALAAAERTFADDPVDIHRGDVAAVVAGLAAPDVVVADPPRAGAGNQVIDALCAARPRAVVHIGCDPASFARDLRRYRDQGYQVQQWRAFDAFPLTHHVEAIALLRSP